MSDIPLDIMFPQYSGPCNGFNYLGHFKKFYDDDDDNDPHREISGHPTRTSHGHSYLQYFLAN